MTTIREILIQACRICGQEEIVKYLSGHSADNLASMQAEEKKLLQAYLVVEREIAMEYLPIYFTEEIDCNGFIALNSLKKQAIAIQKITDIHGAKLPYTIEMQGIKTKKTFVKVTYSIYPKEKNLGDCIELKDKNAARILSLAVACEYCLIQGNYPLLTLLEKKYKEALAIACREKGGIMKMRRWI